MKSLMKKNKINYYMIEIEKDENAKYSRVNMDLIIAHKDTKAFIKELLRLEEYIVTDLELIKLIGKDLHLKIKLLKFLEDSQDFKEKLRRKFKKVLLLNLIKEDHKTTPFKVTRIDEGLYSVKYINIPNRDNIIKIPINLIAMATLKNYCHLRLKSLNNIKYNLKVKWKDKIEKLKLLNNPHTEYDHYIIKALRGHYLIIEILSDEICFGEILIYAEDDIVLLDKLEDDYV